MLRFNQLEIVHKPEGSFLIIDVEVEDDYKYNNITGKGVYIESIAIDNQDTFYSSGGNSSTPIYQYPNELTGLEEGYEETPTRLQLKLSRTEVPLGDLLYVYVKAKIEGIELEDIPCCLQQDVIMGTVVDTYPYYQQAMEYIKEVADTCNPSQNFVDYILKLKGLEVAIKTGNYTEANKFFIKFFKNRGNINVAKGGCGCGNT